LDTPEGCKPVRSPIGASVWTIAVATGQRVEAGQKLLVLEAQVPWKSCTVPQDRWSPRDRYYWRFARRQQHEDFGKGRGSL
jgi:hypothetical protein